MAHILLPTDLSEHALNACAYALDAFGSKEHRYTLVHAYMDPVPGYVEMVDMTNTAYAASVEGLAAFAARFRLLPGAKEAPVDTRVVYGSVASGLTHMTEEVDADLIVMGTRGAGATPLFGTNAGAVAKASRIPVLIVPSGTSAAGIERILFADDHVRVEPLAMSTLVELATKHAAEVLVAHVLRRNDEEPDPHVIADYERTLKDVRYRFLDIPGSDISEALSELAERERVQLVAVLHRHVGILESLFHGSVAKRLAMHSRIPLLVLEH